MQAYSHSYWLSIFWTTNSKAGEGEVGKYWKFLGKKYKQKERYLSTYVKLMYLSLSLSLSFLFSLSPSLSLSPKILI